MLLLKEQHKSKAFQVERVHMKKLRYTPWIICGNYSLTQAKGKHHLLQEDDRLQIEYSTEIKDVTPSEKSFRNTPVLKTKKVEPRNNKRIQPSMFIVGAIINNRMYYSPPQ